MQVTAGSALGEAGGIQVPSFSISLLSRWVKGFSLPDVPFQDVTKATEPKGSTRELREAGPCYSDRDLAKTELFGFTRLLSVTTSDNAKPSPINNRYYQTRDHQNNRHTLEI